jgi:hypothetical protein
LVKELTQHLAYVNEFSELVGRSKNGILDQLSPGLIELMGRLEKLGLLNAKNKQLTTASRSFDGLTAIELDQTTQFNFQPVGATLWEKAMDELDDVYGALGTFAIKMAATDVSTYREHTGGFPAIFVREVGLYIRDTYDFRNDDGDQPLGYWCRKDVRRPGPIDYIRDVDYIDKDGTRYFKVTNASFNKYRDTYKKGGDFMVYSTVQRFPVSIMVHLNDTDFEEYLDRAGK